jgi:hypothetical protein
VVGLLACLYRDMWRIDASALCICTLRMLVVCCCRIAVRIDILLLPRVWGWPGCLNP